MEKFGFSRPLNIHAKTRLQHILGCHCHDDDMHLSDDLFVKAVLERYEHKRDQVVIDPSE